MKPFMRWSSVAVLLATVVLLATSGLDRGASLASASSNAEITPSPFALANPVGSNLRFDRISVEQGLSHSTVNCILQDRYGFIWLGTEDGLNRYDGYELTVYKHDPDEPGSLSHNRVWTLFEDSAGVLWIGTYGGGLNRFDRDRGQFTRYEAGDFGNVTDEPEEFRNVVSAIGEQPPGTLWIATYGGGLVKLDLETARFTSYAPDPHDPALGGHEWITALLVDRSGTLYLGTNSEGLDRFDPGTETFTSYRHDPTDPTSLGHDRITYLAQDQTGQIWIGTDGGGLDRLDPKTGRFDHYRHGPSDRTGLSDDTVRSVLADPSGVLWIGTDQGLDVLDPDGGTFAHLRHDPADPLSLSSDRIRAFYRSRVGLLWVGTQGGGVNRSDPAAGRFVHYRGAADYQVLSLLEDEDRILWIGTAGDGLDALDRQTGTWRHYHHDPADPASLGNEPVLAIHEDSAGILWIGTNEGFYRFDRQTERFERLPHSPPDPGNVKRETIYAVVEDRRGVLWLGTHGRGLSEFHPDTGAFTYHQSMGDPDTGVGKAWAISSNFVPDVLEDASGRLWVGTEDGLNAYDPETGRWQWFRHDPTDLRSLSHNWTTSLYQDRAGTLWVGTQGGGLNRLDPGTDGFRHYQEADGLANDTVLDIVADESGSLWIATANGLSRLDPGTETFKNYQATDGLPIDEFNTAYRSDSGELFFGGINGLLSLDPDQMEDNPHVPVVVLTSLQQNGVAVDTGVAPEDLKEVTFRWPNNSFEFGFAALDYTLPEKNQHAYKLEGFDDTWNDTGNRGLGRYTNLPGGGYTLRLTGANNDGVWNEEGLAIGVTVVPPFWQTGWFWGIVALALTGGTLGGYRLRVRNLEARSQALERQVEARTADLQREVEQRMLAEKALRERERERAVAEERNRLARDLHDSVSQALYGVTLYSEAAAGHLALGNGERAAEHLRELQDTAQEALAEMRLLIFELRPPILEELGLAAALQARLQAVEGRAGVRTEFRTNVEERLPPAIEEGLYRIGQEALNNALKHADAETVCVELHREGNRTVLRIADDGSGFEPATAGDGGGLGLAAMRERAEAIGARLEIESRAGRGTTVAVTWEDEREKGR
jgi:signal transduction histidine kinase/ligand-binding sensor domain-containing protein